MSTHHPGDPLLNEGRRCGRIEVTRMSDSKDSITWRPITATEPPEGVIVQTRINDAKGIRNVQPLTRNGRLWFLPDDSMYVYYDPTEYAPCAAD